MSVKPIPDGFNSVSAYLVVPNAAEALEFYQRAFGAETIARMAGPDGKSTLHAEMRIGNSGVMLAEENERWGSKSPRTLGGTPVSLHIYCEDVDALFHRAVAAGCTVTYPVMDAFWGDRYGKVTDPYGHIWGIATHKEDVSPEECSRRAAAWFSSMGQSQADK
jgi:PhnB protein